MKTPLLLGLAAGLAHLLSAATFTVTTTDSFGPGSLYQAITDGNASVGEPNTIAFNVPGGGVQTIRAVNLPPVTNPVILDGTTQPGYAGTPLIFLDGMKARAAASGGLMITAGNSVVRGLAIGSVGRCCDPGQGPGLLLQDGGSNRVEACFIGVDATGLVNKFNRLGGLVISNSVANVIGGPAPAQRNVISGNSTAGVIIGGAAASNNVVAGNFIGLGPDGATLLGNSEGILILDGATANRIGGTQPGDRNLIVNYGGNVHLLGGAAGNVIQGNFIGLRADGTTLTVDELNRYGVEIKDSPGNLVGGTAAGEGNVISGNETDVEIDGAASSGNVVQGNLIGTDPTGGVRIPAKNSTGVKSIGANGLMIGGATPGAGNVISGHSNDGIYLLDVSDSVVQGNFIGTDVTGRIALGNGHTNSFGGGGSGLTLGALSHPVTNNVIGGAVPAARNVISGNLYVGLQIVGTLAVGNVIQGNFIGTDATGTNALGNLQGGVEIYGADHTLIGGTGPGLGNVISANQGNGILLGSYFGLASSNTVIVGNLLGLPLPGTQSAAARSRAGHRHALPQGPPGAFFDPEEDQPTPVDIFFLYISGAQPVQKARPTLPNFQGNVLNLYADSTTVGSLGGTSLANLLGFGNGVSAVTAAAGSGFFLGGNGYINVSADTTAPVGISPGVNGGEPPPPVITKAVIQGATLHVEGVATAPKQTGVRVEVRRSLEILGDGTDVTGVSFPVASIPGTTGGDGKFAFSGEVNLGVLYQIAVAPRLGGMVVATTTSDGTGTSPDSVPVAVTVDVGGSDTYETGADHYVAGSGVWEVAVQRTANAPSAGLITLREAVLQANLPGPLSFDGSDHVVSFPSPTTVPVVQTMTVQISQPVGISGNRYQFGFVDLMAPSGGGAVGDPASAVLISPPFMSAQPPVFGGFMSVAGGAQFAWPGYFHFQTAANPAGPWVTFPGTVSPFSAPAGGAGGFFRLTSDVPMGAVGGLVGGTAGTVVQVGEGGPIAVTGAAGAFELPQVPAGKFDLLVYARTTVTDGVSGAIEQHVVGVGWPMEVAAGIKTAAAITKVAFSQPAIKTPCECTPWCGLLGGTVNGVPQVVAFGGKNGNCGEIPQITITPPDGTQISNPKQRKSFSPAPNGTYTVTATVCGVTRTCSITLP